CKLLLVHTHLRPATPSAATPKATWRRAPARITLPLNVVLVTLKKRRRVTLSRRHVKQSGDRTIRRIEPVRAALVVREDQRSFAARLRALRPNRPSVFIKTDIPVLLHEI